MFINENKIPPGIVIIDFFFLHCYSDQVYHKTTVALTKLVHYLEFHVITSMSLNIV